MIPKAEYKIEDRLREAICFKTWGSPVSSLRAGFAHNRRGLGAEVSPFCLLS